MNNFSVLMSTYKNDDPTYLYDALQSINNQTVKPNELVLVIDGTIPESLNKVIKIDTDTESYTKAPINYGIGIKIRSLLGPIDFTWGKGHIIPLDKNSKENNIFYFNFGVEI